MDDGSVSPNGDEHVAGSKRILHALLIDAMRGKQISFQHSLAATAGEDFQNLIRAGLGRFFCQIGNNAIFILPLLFSQSRPLFSSGAVQLQVGTLYHLPGAGNAGRANRGIGALQVRQIFDISFRSLYRGIGKPQHGIAVVQGKIQDSFNDLPVNRLVPGQRPSSPTFSRPASN